MSAELCHVIATIVLRQTQFGPIPSIPRYDGHERVWTAPMPYLFQRQIGGVRKVTSPGTILNNLRKQCQILEETNPQFRGLHFTPHDFRRLFATDLVNNGLPIHIGAALLGHVNLQTTQGYVAVFEEDVIRHVQEFLDRAARCAQRRNTGQPRMKNGQSSRSTSIRGKWNLAPVGARTELIASMNMPACGVRNCM
jgi:hypothetical protein